MVDAWRRAAVGLLGLVSVPALAADGVQGRVQEFFLGNGAAPQQKQQVQLGTGLEWTRQEGRTRFD
ncbi:hypothetical protein G4177_20490, partial [Corallococcus sp. ZKHCc1 1396]